MRERCLSVNLLVSTRCDHRGNLRKSASTTSTQHAFILASAMLRGACDVKGSMRCHGEHAIVERSLLSSIASLVSFQAKKSNLFNID